VYAVFLEANFWTKKGPKAQEFEYKMIPRAKSARKWVKRPSFRGFFGLKNSILRGAKKAVQCYHYYVFYKSAVEVLIQSKQGLKH
jgi:hypothetical protein